MVEEDNEFIVNGVEASEPLPKDSLGVIIYNKLKANPSTNDAFVDVVTHKSITYKQALGLSCSLAESLKRAGYSKNSTIAISSENNIQYFIPAIATMYIGAILNPLNQNYTERELIHCLDITKPHLIFCSKKVVGKFLHLKKALESIKEVIVIDSEEPIEGAETMNEFIARKLDGFKLLEEFPVEHFDPNEQVGFIMCSSGTTGLPKGVMLTHTNLACRYMQTVDTRFVSRHNCFFGILPFFHGFGFITNLISFMLQEKIAVLSQFNEEHFLKAIEEYKISTMWLVPPLIVFLAKSPVVDKYDLSSVTELGSGAAPLSKATEEAVKKRLNIKFVRQGYGLTEATLAVIMMPFNEERPGSSGRVMPYMRCKVRDPDTGKSLGPKEVGELCFKGDMVMKGYYNNEEATKESFTSDGWLRTGDLGYYDEEEYFFIVDRLKELIKYKAFQVPPAELEAVLLTNPKIKDAGVVGVPNEDAGELPLAFIVKSPNVEITEDEIQKFVAERVSPPKRLRGGVIFVPAIPKNPSGKILRKDLRQMLQQYKDQLKF